MNLRCASSSVPSGLRITTRIFAPTVNRPRPPTSPPVRQRLHVHARTESQSQAVVLAVDEARREVRLARACGDPAYAAVSALDRAGRQLGTSSTIRLQADS